MHGLLLTIMLLVGLIIDGLSTAQAAEPKPQAKGTASEMIAEAKELVIQRDKLGKWLTAIVSDRTQKDSVRIEAAHQLGKLQYVPAIDVLIKHIEFVDQNSVSISPNNAVDFPLTTALAGYQSAAIPAIVEAFLAERDPKPGLLLSDAIRIGKNNQVALRYLRGTEPPRKNDALGQRNVRRLEKLLAE